MNTITLSPDLVSAWRARTREVEGGHLLWAGGQSRRTPTFRWQGRELSAARIAFMVATGREPEGLVSAGCGVPHCIAPGHVDDTARRQRDRAALRIVLGVPGERPAVCVAGHDQSVDGRLHADGRAYCQACKNVRKARAAA